MSLTVKHAQKLRTLVIAIFVFTCTSFFNPAFARQCIWNKAGFVLNITWFKDGKLARKDRIALGQGNCSDDHGPYTVVLSIVGGQFLDQFTRTAIYGAAAALGAGAAVFAPPTVAGAAAAAAAIAYLADKNIPDAKSTFYHGTPSYDRYLDVWGTAWDPQTGPGGKI